MKLFKKSYWILFVTLTLKLTGCKDAPPEEIMPNNYKINANSADGSISATSPSTDKSILSYYSFDKTIGTWYEKSMFYTYSAVTSDYKKRYGKSGKIQLKKGNNIRAEFGTNPYIAPKEGWYGFSVLFPSNFTTDKSEECIVQFQSKPDFDLGENWRSPPLMLAVLNNRLVLEIRTSSKKMNIQNDYTFERIDLGTITKETWTDFVFHIKWAYDKTGKIELWKGNKLIYSRVNKPNRYNDILYPYFKIGIYKWDWGGISNSTTTQRTIYIDEIKIGNDKASYDKVYPGSK